NSWRIEMKQELRKFVTENFMFAMEDVQLSDSDSLVDKGLIDSTGILELVSFLEEKYMIEIYDTELVQENLDSIDALSRFLETKMSTNVKQSSCS
ncbi:MAG TPA: acyl carrier protein, partial [Terriglobia bacterium]|nr:acyl carrier protein [Terriglobia bacterium]